jgi:hypothetical protein
VGPKSGLDVEEKKKNPYRELNSERLARSLDTILTELPPAAGNCWICTL